MASTAKSAIAALMSLANFHFWLESGYFDAAASTKPLLHTWSLSVEEQYYLFWPALLLLLSGSRLRTPVIVVLLLLSLLASLLLRNSMPDAIFFLLPFRLHQLMAGALIAALSLRLTGAVGSACSVLASIGFIATAVLLEGRLSPATGAAAVTCFGFFLLLGRESIAAKRVGLG